MSELDPRVQLLIDRQEIRDLVYTYARGVDRHDADLVASVYHPDAIDQHGDFVGSGRELAEWGNALHARKYVSHQHHVTCHTVEIDGDEAHAESYLLHVLRRRDGTGLNFGSGRYLDRLERRDGVWKIVARQTIIDMFCEAGGEGPEARRVIGTYVNGTWGRDDPSYARPLVVPVDEPSDQGPGR